MELSLFFLFLFFLSPGKRSSTSFELWMRGMCVCQCQSSLLAKGVFDVRMGILRGLMGVVPWQPWLQPMVVKDLLFLVLLG